MSADRAPNLTSTKGNHTKWALALVMLVPALIHVALIFGYPLAPDETYYWEWSRRLAWGYYDQGPMVAWWIRATCMLFGDTPLGVRFGMVIAALVTRWFLYLLARDLFDERVALQSQIPFAIIPFSMVGGFIATYDPLVVMFWSSAMYYAQRLLMARSKTAWVGLGISFGLGMLSKHTMVVFGFCMLLYILCLPEQRRWLRRYELYAALALGMLVFTPNIVWQAQNHWITFGHLFLLTGKGVDHDFKRRLGDFVGSQAALITPILFLAMIAATAYCAREGRKPGKQALWYLFAFATPLVLFTLFTAKAKVQANWAICGWLTPSIAYVVWLRDRGKPSKRLNVSALILAGLLSLLISVPASRALLPFQFPYKWDQMNKLYGGKEIATAVEDVRLRMERSDNVPITVGAATYDTTSRLAFYLPRHPATCCFILRTRDNSYSLWSKSLYPKPGQNAVLVDDRPPDDPLLPRFEQIFERVVPEPAPIMVYRRGVYAEPVHVYYIYRCYNYKPNPAYEFAQGG